MDCGLWAVDCGLWTVPSKRVFFAPAHPTVHSPQSTVHSNKKAPQQKLKRLVIKWLPNQDSNLDKLNQNQLCYHYTIGHLSFKNAR